MEHGAGVRERVRLQVSIFKFQVSLHALCSMRPASSGFGFSHPRVLSSIPSAQICELLRIDFDFDLDFA